MTLDEFQALADASALSRPLQALWHDARGDWERAHALAQEAGDDGDRDGEWVHAYLHRVEGDDGNAAYWYRRCGRPVSRIALREEWTAIATELLARGNWWGRRSTATESTAGVPPASELRQASGLDYPERPPSSGAATTPQDASRPTVRTRCCE